MALLLVVGCLLAVTLTPAANAAFCSPTLKCWPAESVIASWAKTLSNDSTVLLLSRDQEAVLSHAVAMNEVKSNAPGIVVYPSSDADLRSAVTFAFKHSIRIVARCSGHDFNGRSSGFGVMMIKMKKLNTVVYNATSQTVTFGSGANHGVIYGALAQSGRVYIGGQAKSVCPAGCLSGGCHGLLTRQHGLGADNIVGIRFMLYNGTALDLSATSHPDLFHAYLGAGANSFGLAVSFTARTHPAPEVLRQFKVQLSVFAPAATGLPPSDNALSRFVMNVTFMQSLPVTISANINLNNGTLSASFFYLGPAVDSARSIAMLAPVFESPFVIPGTLQNFTWSNLFELALNNYAPVTSIWARKFVTNALVPPKQELLGDAIAAIAANKPYMWFWFVYGGAVRNGTAPYVSPGMRDAMYEAEIAQYWQDPNEDEDRMASVQQFLPVMHAVTNYTYSNEYTSWGGKYNPLPDWKTRFFGSETRYNNLLKVKKAYDPCNNFVVQFGVGWDRPQATCRSK